MTVETTLLLPQIDLALLLKDPECLLPETLKECQFAAETLKKYSAFAVKDPRVSNSDNDEFLNLVEDYFAQPESSLRQDVRPEVHFQVGATPEGTEVPRCGRDDSCLELVNGMAESDKPADFNHADNKWRFFWRMGERPAQTEFPQLNAAQVLPAAFPNWASQMDKWGSLMHQAVSSVSEMLAVGFGLPRETLVNLAKNGPHLLAPTGSDLQKFGQVGTVLAGFHTDLNFLTIHGKSRFPGLYIWTPSHQKLMVKIPDGCLLVQAGKQMEYLTGGHITAGFHEVVIVPETLVAMQKRKESGRPMWRISSTLFFHIASDVDLEPLQPFRNEVTIKAYPKVKTGHQVQQELGFIALAN